MIANILTKGLTYDKFLRLQALSGVKEQSDFKWEGVLENDALLSDCTVYQTVVNYDVMGMFTYRKYCDVMVYVYLDCSRAFRWLCSI